VRDAELGALADAGATLWTADARDPGALDRLPADYTTIFHLAAILGVARVADQPYAVLRDNVLMLDAVISFARRLPGLRRLVFASTSEVYAGTLERDGLPFPTPESTPLALPGLDRPRTSYMLSKIYGEALCAHAGIPHTIVRPHNVYGPRMGLAHVVPELLQRAYAAPDGGELTVYSPEHRRAFCFVDDAVRIVARLAESPRAEGGVSNLGNAAAEASIAELAEIVIETVGRRLTVVPGADTPGSPARRVPDTGAAEAAAGVAARVPLREGVELTYRWYRQHVFDGGGRSAT
jgi:nucleoside-diphosphate-sugar epimerase